MKHTHNLRPEAARAVRELLLSGEIQQCRGLLRRQGGEMCMEGLLYEAFRRATGRGEWSDYGYVFRVDGQSRAGRVLVEVSRWATGTDDEPTIDGKPLCELNDGGWTFSDFAAALAEEGVPR